MEISGFTRGMSPLGRACATATAPKGADAADGGGPPAADSDVAGTGGAATDTLVGAEGGGPDAALGAGQIGGLEGALAKMSSLLDELSGLVDQLAQMVASVNGGGGKGDCDTAAPGGPVPAPANDALSGAATLGADAAPAPTDDAGLIDRLLSTLDRSARGSEVVEGLRNIDVTVALASDAEMDAQFGENVMGYYDIGADAIILRRDHALNDPAFGAYILAHEARHAIDDASGLEQRWINDATAAAQMVQNPEAFLAQKEFEQTLVAESTAFLYAAQVANELGVRGMPDDPAFNADGSVKTYAEIWATLAQSPTYNPEGRQPPAPRTWEDGVLTA